MSLRRCYVTLLIAVWGAMSAFGQDTSHILIDYDSTTGDFTYLNSVLGTDIFYSAGYLGESTIVANVEAGAIWFGHDAFNRPSGVPSAFFTYNPDSLNQLDYHATLVGQTLAGTGYVIDSNPEQFYLVGIGMAPYAEIWSGAIATEFSSTTLGEFSVSTASVLAPYKAFFNGIDGTRPDVINSSWGGTDPTGTGDETVSMDGLARQNAAVAFVVSAGNESTSPAGAPGSGYNNITVGSVGGPSLRDPSSFTSATPADFYNPQTGETLVGVRAAVDLAAPGENFVLAAYLGDSGSLGASTDPDIQAIVQEPSPSDLYFLDLDGTSFSSPIVAGGIALLKDVAKSPVYAAGMGTESLDTRVIKSVLMASARETTGWDNGQTISVGGMILTTQSLDYATGSGAVDLANALDVYIFGTTDLIEAAGGDILSAGWDLASLAPDGSNEYRFDTAFSEETELTISLNWFVERTFDDNTDIGSELSFANLNLGVWFYGGETPLLVAESSSLYNNTEFLRLTLTDPGFYGITVTHDGMIYDLGSTSTSESYGLAWQAMAVPEPGMFGPVLIGVMVLWISRRRSKRPSSSAVQSAGDHAISQ